MKRRDFLKSSGALVVSVLHARSRVARAAADVSRDRARTSSTLVFYLVMRET
jgi:hypothetical protein